MLVDELHDDIFGNRLATNGNTLPEINQMRGRVLRDLEALRAQHRLRRGDGASLAIGAGNVQHRVREVRIAQCGEQRSRPLETELEDTGRAREQVVHRLRVAGQGDVHPVADGLPLMWRSNWLMVCLRSLRCTT